MTRLSASKRKRNRLYQVFLGKVKVLLLLVEEVLDSRQELAGELVSGDNLDESRLAAPHVSDEGTLALRRIFGETVGLRAGESLDISLVVVSHVCTETTLISRTTELVETEVNAAGVLATFVSALIPVLKDLEGLLGVLQDDEASIEVELTELVLVVGKVGIPGERESVLLRINLPVVHQPLKREIEVVEDGIRVNENTGLVLLEELADDVRLLPRGTAVFGRIECDKVVLVTVEFSCEER